MIAPAINELKFDERGLIPAIVQEKATGEVLMLAYMNKESLIRTMESGATWFFSRSRNRLWNKGETSGNIQKVLDIRLDCDMDTLLVLVDQRGFACHRGYKSCFFRTLEDKIRESKPDKGCEPQYGYTTKGDNAKGYRKYSSKGTDILKELYLLIADRSKNPKEGSYTNYLLNSGIDKILKKVGEEAAEVIIGAKNPDKAETIYEIADLLYHITVLMYYKGIGYDEIFDELSSR